MEKEANVKPFATPSPILLAPYVASLSKVARNSYIYAARLTEVVGKPAIEGVPTAAATQVVRSYCHLHWQIGCRLTCQWYRSGDRLRLDGLGQRRRWIAEKVGDGGHVAVCSKCIVDVVSDCFGSMLAAATSDHPIGNTTLDNAEHSNVVG